jgi:hypothetical protein
MTGTACYTSLSRRDDGCDRRRACRMSSKGPGSPRFDCLGGLGNSDPRPAAGAESGRRMALRGTLAAFASCVALVLSACGQAAPHSPSPTPRPPTARASPSADPTTTAILNAYEQSWAAWHSAAAIPEINYPGITQWFTGQALVRAQGLLTLMVQLGQVETGTRELHPMVESSSGTTAIVQDCLYSTAVIVYKSSGVPVTPQPGGTQPEWDSETATVVLASGSWHVSSGQEEFGSSCRPASPSP